RVQNACVHPAGLRRTGDAGRSVDASGSRSARRGNRAHDDHGSGSVCGAGDGWHFRHNAVFIGPNVREAINDGRADYTPIYLSEIEELFESGAMPIDVALVEVSPRILTVFAVSALAWTPR